MTARRCKLRDVRLDGIQQRLDPGLREAATDAHDAARPVLRWPALEPCRRMEHVLHAVDDGRPIRALGDVDDAFEAQKIGAEVLGHYGARAKRPLAPLVNLARA